MAPIYYSLKKEGSAEQMDLSLRRLVRSPTINFFPCDTVNSLIFIKGPINKSENVKCFGEF